MEILSTKEEVNSKSVEEEKKHPEHNTPTQEYHTLNHPQGHHNSEHNHHNLPSEHSPRPLEHKSSEHNPHSLENKSPVNSAENHKPLSTEEKVRNIKDKVSLWLKNPQNFILLGIFIFAILIRFYYFVITKNQPLWWDESDYMAAAKGFAGLTDYKIESIRSPGFSMIISLFFLTGLSNEPFMRFFGLLIPSLIAIFLLYLCIREMYPDKKVALISTAIFSVLWEHLFYSNRFQTENFSLIFEFLAILILFKGYLKKEKILFIKPPFALIFVALATLIAVFFRPGNAMFIPAIVLFLLILNYRKLSLKTWAMILVPALLALAAFFFYRNKINFLGVFNRYLQLDKPFAWQPLSIFYSFYQSFVSWMPSILYYIFLLGLVFVLFDFYLQGKKIKLISPNKEDLELKSDIFNAFLILSVLAYFIFLLRTTEMDLRWFFPLATGMLAFTSKGIISFSEILLPIAGIKDKKTIAIILVLIVSLGVYNQVVHSDMIIKAKVESYLQVKESGLWMKENSKPTDVIISASIPQHSYYSERKVKIMDQNESKFLEQVQELKPRYFVISAFEPGFTPQWAYDWGQKNNETVRPANVYFADKEKQQPILIVFEFIQKSA